MKNYLLNFRFSRFVNVIMYSLAIIAIVLGVFLTKLTRGISSSLAGTAIQVEQLNLAKDIIWLDEVLTQSVRSYVYSRDKAWLDRYLVHASMLDTVILKVKTNTNNPKVLTLFLKQDSLNQQLVALQNQSIHFVEQDSAASALNVLNGHIYRKLKQEYKTTIDSYIDYSKVSINRMNVNLLSTRQQISWIITLVWTFVISSVVLLIIAFSLLKWMIISPLSQAQLIAKRIGAGDLSLDANGLRTKSEVGKLLASLDAMVLTLRKSIGFIRTSTDHLFAASSEVSNGSQEIAEGANIQAGAAEQVTASIEEMLYSVEQNAVDAKNTLETAELAEQGILKGRESFEHTSKALNEIAEGINVISEIANKTDMLSLNAAVEAARAGHEGKGFAVVAAEVRKLAELTRRSADSITKLVKNNVESAMESGVMLESVLPSVSKTTLLLQKIVRSSVEQTAGLEEINNAIVQFNTSIQQNMVVAEELSASSEELSVQARTLKDSVSFFSLDRTETLQKVEALKHEMEQLQETIFAFNKDGVDK